MFQTAVTTLEGSWCCNHGEPVPESGGGKTLGAVLAVARRWRRLPTKSSSIVDLVNNPSPAGISCISASQQHGCPIISVPCNQENMIMSTTKERRKYGVLAEKFCLIILREKHYLLLKISRFISHANRAYVLLSSSSITEIMSVNAKQEAHEIQ